MSEETFDTYEAVLDRCGALVYTIVGVSMMPLLHQKRDLVKIRKRPEGRLRRYDAVLYKRGNSYILHRILRVRPRDYVIAGDNCWRREFGVTDEQILGVLTGIVRNGREISVNDWQYKCYVHLWCDLFPLRASALWCRSMAKRVVRGVWRRIRR